MNHGAAHFSVLHALAPLLDMNYLTSLSTKALFLFKIFDGVFLPSRRRFIHFQSEMRRLMPLFTETALHSDLKQEKTASQKASGTSKACQETCHILSV